MIRLAWSGKKEIHYIVPILSGALFGFSYVLNMVRTYFSSHSDILIPLPITSLNATELCPPNCNNDVYITHYGASVLAASTSMRFIFSTNFPLFTAQMIDQLGFAWAASLLGFTIVAMIPIPGCFENGVGVGEGDEVFETFRSY